MVGRGRKTLVVGKRSQEVVKKNGKGKRETQRRIRCWEVKGDGKKKRSWKGGKGKGNAERNWGKKDLGRQGRRREGQRTGRSKKRRKVPGAVFISSKLEMGITEKGRNNETWVKALSLDQEIWVPTPAKDFVQWQLDRNRKHSCHCFFSFKDSFLLEDFTLFCNKLFIKAFLAFLNQICHRLPGFHLITPSVSQFPICPWEEDYECYS